jgi:hypothetical protein
MKDNIFTYEGPRGELVETFYRFLMSGKVISYEDILADYDGGELSSQKVTGHDLYKTLKHVVPEVVGTLQKSGYGVLKIPKGSTTLYQYIGSNKNPLKKIRYKALLLERNGIISQCIKEKRPINITYKPFDRKQMDIVFHPHLIYTYNGRTFAFGVSEREGKNPFRRFCIALDRIHGEIKSANSDYHYIAPEPDEYSYLANIVGVRLEEGSDMTTIRIRALDQYTFGRLTTKPLHDSQNIIESPNWKEGREYGDVEIKVIPNVELIGQILSYGSTIKILSPDDFKQKVAEELTKTLSLYKGS